MSKLLTVVLNWNNPGDTVECVASLLAAGSAPSSVLIIDNGSTDDSVDRIRSSFPGLELACTGKNLGYTGGNNFGIRRALERGFEYVLCLNNDTLVGDSCLETLLEAMENDPRIGASNPLIVNDTGTDRWWTVGGRVNLRTGLVRERMVDEPWQGDAPMDVDYACGTAILLRADALRRSGPFDERFYLYVEDVDLSLRIKDAGYRLVCVPEALITHSVSRSTRKEAAAAGGSVTPLQHYYLQRNLIFLLRKHASWLEYAVAVPWVLTRRVGGLTAGLLLRRRWSKVRALWRGVVDGFTADLDQPAADRGA